jgi:hypothetical protein
MGAVKQTRSISDLLDHGQVVGLHNKPGSVSVDPSCDPSGVRCARCALSDSNTIEIVAREQILSELLAHFVSFENIERIKWCNAEESEKTMDFLQECVAQGGWTSQQGPGQADSRSLSLSLKLKFAHNFTGLI